MPFSKPALKKTLCLTPWHRAIPQLSERCWSITQTSMLESQTIAIHRFSGYLRDRTLSVMMTHAPTKIIPLIIQLLVAASANPSLGDRDGKHTAVHEILDADAAKALIAAGAAL